MARFARWAARLRRALPPEVWFCFALALTLRIALALSTRYTSEDYMITLRYAEHLARGHGLVYNVREHVLGTTTPLYTLLLALASRVGLDATSCGKCVNIAADALSSPLLYLVMRRTGLEKPGRIGAALVAVHPLHAQWAISGMETGLVTAVGLWALYCFVARRDTALFLALGILFLLRWDSLLLSLILGAAVSIRRRAIPWRGLLLFALVIVPWLVGATLYYGSPIPITGQAKVVVYGWFADHLQIDRLRSDAANGSLFLGALFKHAPEQLVRRLPRLQKLLHYFLGSPAQAALTAAALWGALRMPSAVRSRLAAPFAWFCLYLAAFLISRVLLFNWYLLPPLPIFELFAASGLYYAGEPLLRRIAPAARRALLCAAAAAAGALCFAAMAPVLRQSQSIETNLRAPIGLWMRNVAQPGDRVLLEPIGYIGYCSGLRVIDVIGLVSPQALPFYNANSSSPWLDQIRTFRPEWCVLRPLELADIEQASRTDRYDLYGDYAAVRTFTYAPRPNEPPLAFTVLRRVSTSDRNRRTGK